jgi:hypothetical protein
MTRCGIQKLRRVKDATPRDLVSPLHHYSLAGSFIVPVKPDPLDNATHAVSQDPLAFVPTAPLRAACQRLQEIALDLGRIQQLNGIPTDPGSYLAHVNLTLVDVVRPRAVRRGEEGRRAGSMMTMVVGHNNRPSS